MRIVETLYFAELRGRQLPFLALLPFLAPRHYIRESGTVCLRKSCFAIGPQLTEFVGRIEYELN